VGFEVLMAVSTKMSLLKTSHYEAAEMYLHMLVLQLQPLQMEIYLLVVTPLIQELFLFTVRIFSETVISQYLSGAVKEQINDVVICGNHS
jgi:hypothetical protein